MRLDEFTNSGKYSPLYFQQNYLQLFVCLSISAFSPPPGHSSRQAQWGNRGPQSVKAASLLCLFHLQTRGLQSDCRREKPSPSQRGCCFRAVPICCTHPDFPRSHWAIQEITADTEPFVSLLCSPRSCCSIKKNRECSFPSPPEETPKIISVTLKCINFSGKDTKKSE